MELEITSFLQFALELIIILTAAKMGGLLSTKLGQPSVLGELLAGIILGPSLFNITAFPFITDPEMLNEFIRELGEIGVLFLMFLAGLELHLSDLTRNTRSAVLIALMGMVLSLGLGSMVGFTRGFTGLQPLFIGLALAATSISITAQTLMELNNLRGKVGLGLLGAAVVDDILVLLVYSVLLAVASGTAGWSSIAGLILQIGLFFVITIGFGLKLLPSVTRWVSKRRISQGLVTFAIIILLVFSFLAQSLGHLAAILGAFLAGIMFSRTEEKGIIEIRDENVDLQSFCPDLFCWDRSTGRSPPNRGDWTLASAWIDPGCCGR